MCLFVGFLCFYLFSVCVCVCVVIGCLCVFYLVFFVFDLFVRYCNCISSSYAGTTQVTYLRALTENSTSSFILFVCCNL
mgnify:CR=1 FL=1